MWSDDNDKASLSAAQSLLEETLPKIKAIEGASVQRIICGGCHDFKIIISLPAEYFNKLEEAAIEEAFLAALGVIAGISSVETQTYTIMSM